MAVLLIVHTKQAERAVKGRALAIFLPASRSFSGSDHVWHHILSKHGNRLRCFLLYDVGVAGAAGADRDPVSRQRLIIIGIVSSMLMPPRLNIQDNSL